MIKKHHQPITPKLRELTLIRDYHSCRSCTVSNLLIKLEVHRINPNLPDTRSNLITLCKTCNSALKMSTTTRAIEACLARAREISPTISPRARKIIHQTIYSLYNHKSPQIIRNTRRPKNGNPIYSYPESPTSPHEPANEDSSVLSTTLDIFSKLI